MYLKIPEKIGECALHVGQPVNCTADNIHEIKSLANKLDIGGEIEPQRVIYEAKNKLRCDTEKCVYEKLGRADIVAKYFKIKGPTNTDLLSNFEIDAQLLQWETIFDDFFGYNFNMADYAGRSFRNGYVCDEPDTLATITVDDLMSGVAGKKRFIEHLPKFPVDDRPKRRWGCVINSDVSTGSGMHWMALYCDARNKRDTTVEFFNSSGNKPAACWCNWMVKMQQQLMDRGHVVRLVSNRLGHQNSKSECGVYSLYYIWSRLNDVRPEVFNEKPVNDKVMFEFRQHLFEGEMFKPGEKFDYDKFKKMASVRWARSVSEVENERK